MKRTVIVAVCRYIFADLSAFAFLTTGKCITITVYDIKEYNENVSYHFDIII